MAEKVTLAEAKALGFNSAKGITKEGGMYKFADSLAPDRSGFLCWRSMPWSSTNDSIIMEM
jgi:hypothetical protein